MMFDLDPLARFALISLGCLAAMLAVAVIAARDHRRRAIPGKCIECGVAVPGDVMICEDCRWLRQW